MKRLLLIGILFLLPGCKDEEIYGKIVDNEPNYYPYLTREERIYMKMKEEKQKYDAAHPQMSVSHSHVHWKI